jgi:hypothetical protein
MRISAISPAAACVWLLALAALAPRADSQLDSDPSCAHGISSGGVCCAKRCGECGGTSCSSLPGGASDCCKGKIESSGRSCAAHDAPCILGPAPAPPGPAPPPGPATITLDGAHVVATVAPEYVSFNFDTSSLASLNLSTTSVLATLAEALTPAHLRVGGTQGDYEVYSFGAYKDFDCSHPPSPMTAYRCKTLSEQRWGELLDFAATTNVTLLFGLNDLFMRPTKTKPEQKLCGADGAGPCPPRNLSNAEALLRWTVSQRPPRSLWGLELGNELNSCLNGKAGAKAQADDFAALAALVDEVWSGPAAAQRPVLIGPDTHSAAEYQPSGLDWFDTFINRSLAVGDHVQGFTFHM